MKKPSLVYRIVKVVILAGFAVVIIFPFYWIIITSLKETKEIFSVPISFFPRKFSLQNYRDLFQALDFGRYIINSILVSLVAASAASIVSLCGGYVLARFKFRGKQIVIYFYLITQMLPSFIGLAPLYQMLSRVGMIDKLPSLMILNATWLIPYSTITIRGYLMRVPRALEESAMIDGCNRIHALIRIVFPLILSGFSATFIFCFVQALKRTLGIHLYTLRLSNLIDIGKLSQHHQHLLQVFPSSTMDCEDIDAERSLYAY